MTNSIDKKTIALLSYLTWIGLIIAMILYYQPKNKQPFAAFHLRQSLGLSLLAILIIGLFRMSGSDLFYFSLPSLFVLLSLVLLWVLGFKSAMDENEKPVPVMGSFFQKMFSFIN